MLKLSKAIVLLGMIIGLHTSAETTQSAKLSNSITSSQWEDVKRQVFGARDKSNSQSSVDGTSLNLLAKLTSNDRNEGSYYFNRFFWAYDGGGDNFGQSIAISGNWLAVGVPKEVSDDINDRLGVVYLFKKSNDTWIRQSIIKIPKGENFINNGSAIGTSVALDGNVLLIGESYHDFTGAVYVYEYTNKEWQQTAFIKPDDLTSRNLFGGSIAIDGDTFVVGAQSVANISYGDSVKPGSAYVFNKQGNQWTQVARLKAQYQIDGNLFGYSVDIDKDTIVIGAPQTKTRGIGGEVHYGTAFVFKRIESEWKRVASLISPESNSEYYLPFNYWRIKGFGVDVGISSNKIVVGEPQYPMVGPAGNNINNVGAAHVFELDESQNVWNNSETLTASNWGQDDQFGYVVAIEADTILVGSPFEDSDSSGINGADNNLANSSGAAYLYTKLENRWQQSFYIKSPNPINHILQDRLTTADIFAKTVALNGQNIVIGSPGEQMTSGAVYAYSKGSIKISEFHTGLWYNPNETGHGLNFYLLEDNRVVALWYTYDNAGNQQWLVGVGSHDGYTATMDVHTRAGGVFPPGEDMSDAQYWGKFTIGFSNCNTGYFSWKPIAGNGFDSGRTRISRLTTTESLNCVDEKITQPLTASFSMKDSNSALWYNPNGAFLSNLFMLPNNRILYMWYTFDNNNQPIWLQGIGSHDGVKATMDAYIFDGAKFPPNYNQDELNINHWGRFELEFSDCSNGLFKWIPDRGNGFNAGETVLSRLTKTKGLNCID